MSVGPSVSVCVSSPPGLSKQMRLSASADAAAGLIVQQSKEGERANRTEPNKVR